MVEEIKYLFIFITLKSLLILRGQSLMILERASLPAVVIFPFDFSFGFHIGGKMMYAIAPPASTTKYFIIFP